MTFTPAWWLPGPHAQTLYPTLTRRLKPPVDRMERIELPDGDFLDLAWMEKGLAPTAPLVVLLHGLGGSLSSTYVARQLDAYKKAGFRGVLMHFRGANEAAPNRLPRAYHFGETEDLDFVLKLLQQREPHTVKFATGFSLGGGVLLNWLSAQKQQALIQAAVAVSVPFQLEQLADHMNQGFARVYQAYLLRKLYRYYQRKHAAYPSMMPDYLKDLREFKSFWQFDEHVTAPLHGYLSAKDYYQKTSPRQHLKSIDTPTLILHAKDDPFVPASVIPAAHEISKDVTLEVSASGGHVGFIAGHMPGRGVYWLDQRIPAFFKHQQAK